MKNRSLCAVALVTIIFSLSTTALLSIDVKGFIGHYTIQEMDPDDGVWASRCDHLVSPPSTTDAWTGCGISAYRYSSNRYGSAIYTFNRGYGGSYQSSQQNHNWTYDSSMLCRYQVDSLYDWFYDPANANWEYFGGWYSWRNVNSYTYSTIAPNQNGYTVGCTATSWFKLVNDPNTRTYIQSDILPTDMYASGPNYRDG